jgi:hypothetical protein
MSMPTRVLYLLQMRQDFLGNPLIPFCEHLRVSSRLNIGNSKDTKKLKRKNRITKRLTQQRELKNQFWMAIIIGRTA